MRIENKVKTAIVGCGQISDTYMKNLTGPEKKFDIINLIGCCDIRPERAQARAEQYNLKIMTIEEICADPEIEMVINLTNPAAHYEVSKQLLLAGKNVYSEKIMTIHLEEAEELVAIANEKGLYLGAAPDTFLGAAGQTARQIVESGLIGEVSSCVAIVNRDYYLMPEHIPYVLEKGGGLGFDVGIYYVTALLSILGSVKQVCGFMKTRHPDRIHMFAKRDNFEQPYHVESENQTVGSMLFDSGVVGTLHFNSECIMNERPYLAIYGTQGILYMGDPNQFGEDVLLVRKGQTEPVVIPPNFGYSKDCRGLGAAEMAWSMRKKRPHRASKELALHALEVLYGVAISEETGKTYTLKSTYQVTPPLPQGYLESDYYASDAEASLVF